MSDDNGNGSLPPDEGGEKDKSQLLHERLHKLQGLVLQHALPHVRAAVLKNLAELNMVGDRIDKLADILRADLLSQGELPADVEDAVAAARENMELIGRGDTAVTEEIVGMALLESAPKVVASWANTLAIYASRGGGLAWLRTSMLGDDMLPANDAECDEAFTEDFNEDSPIDGDTARAILRDIRASLPAGKALPEDMIVALDLAWGIVVVP
jgi:hypothetical protein